MSKLVLVLLLALTATSYAEDQVSLGSCGTMGCNKNQIPTMNIDIKKQTLDTLKGYFRQTDSKLKAVDFKISYEFEESSIVEKQTIFRKVTDFTDKVVEKCSYTINLEKPQFPDLLISQISESGCAELF